jgi:hypothetical protein
VARAPTLTPASRQANTGSAHRPGACASRTCTYVWALTDKSQVPHLHLRRPHGHVREGAQIGSVLLAGLAAVLDFSGRRRTVMDDLRRRPGTELRRELRLEPNDACPPNGSGNGHRRRSERWRWDLNPREGYPSTRFRVLRTHVQARSPAPATCSTDLSAGVTEPPRTTTNETKTETRSDVASSAGLGPQRPTLPMTARCASATNPVAPGTASVIPPSRTQVAVRDETLAS